MKKSIVVLSALVLFAGVSFGQDKAAPAKQDAKTSKDAKGSKTDAKATKPAAKSDAKSSDGKATKPADKK